MSGGPREWTSGVAGKGNRRIVKGGLRANAERGTRCAFAVDEAAKYADRSLAFRCCLDVTDVAENAPEPAEDASAEGAPAQEQPQFRPSRLS